MHSPLTVSRRHVVTVLAGTALAGCAADTAMDRQLRFSTLAQASDELTALATASARLAAPGWNWAQVLAHCAQSIEYSLDGFPQPKPRIFQATVGAAAFAVFEARGRMSHGLTEPIPGAPALAADLQETQALQRLRDAIARFMAHQGPLQPHFAYGALDKSRYEAAHAMHIANHLSAFSVG